MDYQIEYQVEYPGGTRTEYGDRQPCCFPNTQQLEDLRRRRDWLTTHGGAKSARILQIYPNGSRATVS